MTSHRSACSYSIFTLIPGEGTVIIMTTTIGAINGKTGTHSPALLYPTTVLILFGDLRSRSPVSSYHGRERSRRDDGRERLEERRERHDGERSVSSSSRHMTREGRGPSSITR